MKVAILRYNKDNGGYLLKLGKFRNMKSTLFLILILLLVSCQKQQSEDKIITGYIEEELRLIASPQSGWIIENDIVEGDRIQPGQLLFRLDNENQVNEVKTLEKNLEAAKASINDMQKGARPDELKSMNAQLQEAQSRFELAQNELVRAEKLFKKGLLDQSKLDTAKSNKEVIAAQIKSLQSKLNLAQLGARSDQIIQAQAQAEAIVSQLSIAKYNLSQRDVYSGISGVVKEVLYHKGEYVQPSSIVLKLQLPELNKVRFYIPQSELVNVSLNQKISVSADGMSQPVEARISYISESVEFTPPVIYSNESRDKLVFLVEARLSAESSLHAGLPVDIKL